MTAANHSAATVYTAVRRWFAYRDTVGDLRKLPSRQLADIGAEGDVEGFAWNMADRVARR